MWSNVEHMLRTCSSKADTEYMIRTPQSRSSRSSSSKKKKEDVWHEIQTAEVDLRTKEGRRLKIERNLKGKKMTAKAQKERNAERRLKTVWNCPHCDFVVQHEKCSTYKIWRHLSTVHLVEFEKQKERNEELGISWKRHSFTPSLEEKPPKFEKMNQEEKKKAFVLCPFCRWGIKDKPQKTMLLYKAKKIHLKECKKAPEGTTMKDYKKQANWKLRDTAWWKNKIEKLKDSIKKRKLEKARKAGHDPKILDLKTPDKGKHYLQWCRKCHRTNQRESWYRECEKEDKSFGDLIRPNLEWWYNMSKQNTLKKIFEETEIDEEKAESIRKKIMKRRAKIETPEEKRARDSASHKSRKKN